MNPDRRRLFIRRRRTPSDGAEDMKVGGQVESKTSAHCVGPRINYTAFILVLCVLRTSMAIAGQGCSSADLLGSSQDIELTPRGDTSTEAVAVGIDGEIVADSATYDWLIADQIGMELDQERELPPLINSWSGEEWIGTAQITFQGAEWLADYMEGIYPAFDCMNEYYDLDFVQESAGEDVAYGTFSTEKVLNWDLLGEAYLELEGIDDFEATSESRIVLSPRLVAARYDGDNSYHYFLKESADDYGGPYDCPEPCTGYIITYYWSVVAGAVKMLATYSTDDEDKPCWWDLFQEVKSGPPSGGVTMWKSECEVELLEAYEDTQNTGGTGSVAVDTHGSADGNDSPSAMAVAVVVVPTFLIVLLCIAAVVFRIQRSKRKRKMQASDEAWGEGKDGTGAPDMTTKTGMTVVDLEPRGGVATPTVSVSGDGSEGAMQHAAPASSVVLTDISVEDDGQYVVEVGGVMAGGHSEFATQDLGDLDEDSWDITSRHDDPSSRDGSEPVVDMSYLHYRTEETVGLDGWSGGDYCSQARSTASIPTTVEL